MATLLHPFYKKPELFSESSLLALKDQYINKNYDEDEQLQIDAEIVSFMNNLGPSFARAVVLREEATKFPLTWWKSYGRQGLPRLTHLALRILSQVLLSLSQLHSNFISKVLIIKGVNLRLQNLRIVLLTLVSAIRVPTP